MTNVYVAPGTWTMMCDGRSYPTSLVGRGVPLYVLVPFGGDRMKLLGYDENGHALVQMTNEDIAEWELYEPTREQIRQMIQAMKDRATCHPAFGYHATPHVGCILR